MKTKLFLMCVMAASAAYSGAAMPTEAEVEKAVPKVERMLASEKVALASGKMTRAEVAAAAMKLAADADDEAAKLLLMKGAFILHVKDGDLEKAVKTMNALETAIADMPPQIITNIIETALLGLPNKAANGARLYRLLDSARESKVADGENQKAVVGGYTWSYSVKNGVATIEAKKDGKPCCSVSPKPTGDVVIPSTLGGANVTSIGKEAFRDCKGLEAVTIPPSVTNIGDLAFYSCDIKSVNIPASVTSIGTQAFSDNSELMSFSVEESNPSYSSRNGLLCTKDGATLISGTSGDVEIPSSVTSIGDWAFTGRRMLTSVTIPPSVTNIGRTAFRCCSGLKAITIPPAVTRLDSNVFRECSGLTSVVIPSNVTSIGWCAFWKCSGLKSVTIPSSVTIIGGNAFGCCGELKSVSIPENVTSIGREAFRWCRALESVTIPSNLKILEQGAFASTGLKSVTIPTNVTSIGRGAVAGCVNLTAVMIPDSVTNIGIDAFRGSGRVKSVAIPSSVRSISDHAFAVCGELTTVTMRGERPTAPNNIFQDCAKLISIRVPANAKSWAGMKEWQGIPLVFDGELVGRVEQMQTETEKAQRDAERAEQRRQLLAIQDELKRVRGMKDSSPEVRAAVESILKGMIKVPGRDYWLSATEVTQEQWEPIMEFNLSRHKGAKLPVECVSRDDCDVFLEKLNQTKEVRVSQFEFVLPSQDEWAYAARGGGEGTDCWVKPGAVGNVLDMAWVKENSSNETHVVATKMPNAFGLYDMAGNVWEWTSECDGSGKNYARGGAFGNSFETPVGLQYWHKDRNRSWRGGVDIGLRLAAHKKLSPVGGLRRPGQQGGSLRARWLQRRQEAQKAIHQEKVDGYTWSFRVSNGEAEIVADEKLRCAVSPSPTGRVAIPPMLGGAKVTSIGKEAFKGCGGLTSMTISENVKSIGQAAFYECGNLTAMTLPQGLVSIGANAFMGCRKLAPVTIPAGVTNIGEAAFAYCLEMKHIDVEVGNQVFASIDGVVYTKDRAELVVCPSGMTSVAIPDSVMKIRNGSFTGCEGLTSLTIPPTVKSIGAWAFSGSRLTSLALPQGLSEIEGATFWGCHDLTSVTIPDSVTSIGGNAFRWCGKLTTVTIPKGVKSIGGEAFYDCGGLTSITMRGERPTAPTDIFQHCGNLKSIHVPANAKSWAGMKEWQGIPLVFD